MPLRIAFIGFNHAQTWRCFDQLAYNNKEPGTIYKRTNGLLILPDGTQIVRIDAPAARYLRGHRFDQTILADDWRMGILATQAEMLTELWRCMERSLIPEEFRWLSYDPDSEEEGGPNGEGRFYQFPSVRP